MDFKPFEKKIWLSSPTMHGEELQYMKEAYDTNWMSTVGANINEVERIAAEKAVPSPFFPNTAVPHLHRQSQAHSGFPLPRHPAENPAFPGWQKGFPFHL